MLSSAPFARAPACRWVRWRTVIWCHPEATLLIREVAQLSRGLGLVSRTAFVCIRLGLFFLLKQDKENSFSWQKLFKSEVCLEKNYWGRLKDLCLSWCWKFGWWSKCERRDVIWTMSSWTFTGEPKKGGNKDRKSDGASQFAPPGQSPQVSSDKIIEPTQGQ